MPDDAAEPYGHLPPIDTTELRVFSQHTTRTKTQGRWRLKLWWPGVAHERIGMRIGCVSYGRDR